MSSARSLGRLIPAIAAKTLGRRGAALGALLADWASVVGPELAERTVPDRLVAAPGGREGATLHLRVGGALALELQHEAPRLIERINTFFGQPVVARLKLIPTPGLPARRPAPPARELTAEEEARIAAAAARIADPELRAALDGFGRAVLAARPQATHTP